MRLQSIIAVVLALAVSGCASAPETVRADKGDGSRRAPLLIYRTMNNLNGRQDAGSYFRIGFANQSQRVIKQVTFSLALYSRGLPDKFRMPLTEPVEVTAKGTFLPGERYHVDAMKWSGAAYDGSYCAKIVGMKISFGTERLSVGKKDLEPYFAPGVDRNCWNMHVPVPDAAVGFDY